MLNQTPVPAGQTAIKGATVAAPSAGATIVNLNAGAVQAPQVYGPAGIYRIAGLIALTGTAETALANVRLQWNNTSQTSSLLSLSGQAVPFLIERADLDGVNVVALIAVANATAGSIYNAILSATRIG